MKTVLFDTAFSQNSLQVTRKHPRPGCTDHFVTFPSVISENEVFSSFLIFVYSGNSIFFYRMQVIFVVPLQETMQWHFTT